MNLSRCPHCNVDTPTLKEVQRVQTASYKGDNQRVWGVYNCSRCGGLVTAWAINWRAEVQEVFPKARVVDESIPDPAKTYLEQSINSLHAPAGAIMLAASAVDSMLKSKNYKEGSLYGRINKAAQDHLITEGMSKWAHKVRLDANDQRHADEVAGLPNSHDAQRTVDFALALAEFLFVLPSKVQHGLSVSE